MSVSYTSKLSEAREFWDLGYYGKASLSFSEAENHCTDLALAVEFSGFLVAQGFVERGREKISRALIHLKDGAEDSAIGMAEMLVAATTTFITGRFSRSLRTTTQVYNQFLDGSDPENYTKRMISMEVLYHTLNGLASGVGVSVTGPATAQDKLRNIFQHCLSKGWFDQARKIASMYTGPVGALTNISNAPVNSDKFQLFHALLKEDSVSDIVRAEALLNLSELLREIDDMKLSEKLADDAKNLYRKAGHACGAYLVEIEELKRPTSRKKSSQRHQILSKMKDRLEEVENWSGVAEVARAMYQVAMERPDYGLMGTLDHEIDRIMGICGRSITWYSWQLVTFQRWGMSGGNTGKLLPSLEALYTSLEVTEASRLKDMAANMISEAFSKLGDQSKAEVWKARVERPSDYSKVEAMNHDPFLIRLSLLTTVSTTDEMRLVDLDLVNVLHRLAQETSQDVAISERWVAVMKLSNICDYYLNQVQLRGLEQTKSLVRSCLETALPLLANLAAEQAALWTGSFLQVEARISFFEALLLGPEVNLSLLQQSVVAHEKVVEYYRKLGLRLKMAFALQQLANCQQQLWLTGGRPPDSDSFFSAVRSFESAAKVFDNGGYSDTLRMNTRFQLKLWLFGCQSKVKLQRGRLPLLMSWLMSWFGYQQSSPFQKAVKCLDDLEHMVNAQRHDLSALPKEQALLSKQALRNNDDVRAIYESGILLYGIEEKLDLVWETVQKSKARSVSDLLGLGVNIPRVLQSRIDEDPKAKGLLAIEFNLLHQVEQEASDGQFQLRKDLDAHRRLMRNEACLSELLELREGTPVTAYRLRALWKLQKAHGSERQIFYADWMMHNGRFWLMVVTPNGIPFYNLGMTKGEVELWKKSHLDGKEEPLNDDDRSPLQELSKLVEPLANLSKEGDLLVLSPSDSLHHVPLHAATISKDSKTSLIERNPIVYCDSMTIFEQCAIRADSKTGRVGKTKQVLLAAYERPIPERDDWRLARDETYETCREMVTEMENCEGFTGAEVDRPRFLVECETSDTIHFIGHCEIEDNALKQYIILCSGSARSSKEGIKPVADETNPRPSPSPELIPEDQFTISDMFATLIKAKHFNLLACASASQKVNCGDEPWGLVTSLLCAGATSVGGTLWEVQIGTAQEYLKTMYLDVLQTGNGEDNIVDVAVALQKTVKKLKRNPDYRAPYHWAAFVLNGSWFHR